MALIYATAVDELLQDVQQMDVHNYERVVVVSARWSASRRLTQAGCDKLRQAAAWMFRGRGDGDGAVAAPPAGDRSRSARTPRAGENGDARRGRVDQKAVVPRPTLSMRRPERARPDRPARRRHRGGQRLERYNARRARHKIKT